MGSSLSPPQVHTLLVEAVLLGKLQKVLLLCEAGDKSQCWFCNKWCQGARVASACTFPGERWQPCTPGVGRGPSPAHLGWGVGTALHTWGGVWAPWAAGYSWWARVLRCSECTSEGKGKESQSCCLTLHHGKECTVWPNQGREKAHQVVVPFMS